MDRFGGGRARPAVNLQVGRVSVEQEWVFSVGLVRASHPAQSGSRRESEPEQWKISETQTWVVADPYGGQQKMGGNPPALTFESIVYLKELSEPYIRIGVFCGVFPLRRCGEAARRARDARPALASPRQPPPAPTEPPRPPACQKC